MLKFTKIKKDELKREDNENIFNNDEISIIKFDDKEIVSSKDQIIILPYFSDDSFFLMKYEKLPAFRFKYQNKSEYNNIKYYLTSIKSDVDESISIIQNVRKILYEKIGLVLSQMFPIEIDKVLFKQDNNVGQYHICVLNIRYNDYKQTSIKITDENKIVKINLGDIDNIKTYDMATDYLLLKLKYDLNLRK